MYINLAMTLIIGSGLWITPELNMDLNKFTTAKAGITLCIKDSTFSFDTVNLGVTTDTDYNGSLGIWAVSKFEEPSNVLYKVSIGGTILEGDD
jgi:hypothetical protein